MTLQKIAYTAEALSTGHGRDGHVRTSDDRVDLDMATPKEMGGSGAGANPEQLFAAGYSACFHSALLLVAQREGVKLDGETVGALVHIGPNGEGGFQLAVELEVAIPGVAHEQAQALADAAHQVCPYSNATRGNIDVTVVISDS